MSMVRSDLRTELLARLARFQTRDPQRSSPPAAAQLFSYCALSRERLMAVTLPEPVLGVVLRGAKEVWQGDTGQTLRRGTVFALPAGVPLDLVNIPDARDGIYESLVLRIIELPPQIRPQPAPHRLDTLEIALTPDLVEALAHAATAIRDSRHGPDVARLRLAELLSLVQADPAGRLLTCADLVARARWLVAARPDQDWQVATLARALGVGASTLRRRLGAAGVPFRALVAGVRMQAAQAALRAGASAGVAADLAGYRSRGRFARAYRAAHGRVPSQERAAGAETETARPFRAGQQQAEG